MLFSDPRDESQRREEESGVGLVELKCWWDTHVNRARGLSVGSIVQEVIRNRQIHS